MTTLVFIGAGVLALVAFVLLAARHGSKRWTDEEYERQRSGGTALGNAFLATQALLDSPGAQAAVEQRMVEEVDSVEAEGGTPDEQ